MHRLTQVTKSVNSSGYTTNNLRSMTDAELVKLLGADRVARLAACSAIPPPATNPAMLKLAVLRAAFLVPSGALTMALHSLSRAFL